MAIRLRAFTEADYSQLTALYNRCRPEVPETEASIRAFDEAFKDEELLNIVAEDGTALVGAAWAHPDQTGKQQVRFDILALAESPDLAETLYGVGLEHLRPAAKSIVVRVRENWTNEWADLLRRTGF